jgi:hypothetical protein
MANPVQYQYPRSSSWAGAASQQAPSAFAFNWNPRQNTGAYDVARAAIQARSQDRATDAQFAVALPSVGLQQLGAIGRQGITDTGGTLRTGIAGATELEKQDRYIKAQEEAAAKQAKAGAIGGILGGASDLAGALGQPALGAGLKAAGNLFG